MVTRNSLVVTWCLSVGKAEWRIANIHSRSVGISHEDLTKQWEQVIQVLFYF